MVSRRLVQKGLEMATNTALTRGAKAFNPVREASKTIAESVLNASKQTEGVNLPASKSGTLNTLAHQTVKLERSSTLPRRRAEPLSLGIQSCIEGAFERTFGRPLARSFSTSAHSSDLRPEIGPGIEESTDFSRERDLEGIVPDLGAFKRNALQCGLEFYDSSVLKEEKIAWAYDMYQKAKRGANLGIIVLGRVRLEEGALPSNPEFPYMDKAMEIDLILANEDLTKETGSIIGLETSKWSLLANDGWILGGVHMGINADEKIEFHFASPLRWENFWNEKTGRMTLMAREIIQLIESGYEIIRPNPKLEPVAVCVDKEKARNASLLKYKEAVERYWDSDKLRAFFESLPEEVRE